MNMSFSSVLSLAAACTTHDGYPLHMRGQPPALRYFSLSGFGHTEVEHRVNPHHTHATHAELALP